MGERVLSRDLAAIRVGMELGQMTKTCEWKQSATYVIKTKYICYRRRAHLVPDYEWPDFFSVQINPGIDNVRLSIDKSKNQGILPGFVRNFVFSRSRSKQPRIWAPRLIEVFALTDGQDIFPSAWLTPQEVEI